MGSIPDGPRYVLQYRPDEVTWSVPRLVVLQRGPSRKLGLLFKTFSLADQSETATVVLQVKEGQCHCQEGSLRKGDRIVSIRGSSITTSTEPQVKDMLSRLDGDVIELQVRSAVVKENRSVSLAGSVGADGSSIASRNELCVKQMCGQSDANSQELQEGTVDYARADPKVQATVKRFLSTNSGTSSGSTNTSVDSAERPTVKRFAKSNSTDTENLNVSPPLSRARGLPVGATSNPNDAVNLKAHLQQKQTGSDELGHSVGPSLENFNTCVQKNCFRSTCMRKDSNYISSSVNKNTHSLPARMEDDVILPDDIELLEVAGPYSLPAVLSVKDRRTGVDVGHVDTSRSPKVEVCQDPECSVQQKCLWHSFVIKYPQYIIWDPFTKAIELVRHKESSSFGFKYKVKKFEGPPAEVFALVTEVSSGVESWNQLLRGDWIRSINGTAIDTPKKAFRDFHDLSSLRLVIQRPAKVSRRGYPRLKLMAESLNVRLNVPNDSSDSCLSGQWQSSETNARLTVPCPPSLSGQWQSSETEDVAPSEQCVMPRVRVVICGAHGSAADFVRAWLGDGCKITLDAEKRVQTFKLALNCNGCLGRIGKVSTSGLCPPPTLAKVGQHHCFCPNGNVNFETDSRSKHRYCSTFSNGGCGEFVNGQCNCTRHNGNTLGESGQDGMRHGISMLGQVSAVESDVNVELYVISDVNVELYVISDDEFFHHCSAWLLPTCALVILTFSNDRLLNQPDPETSRLADMIHTVRSCATVSNSAVRRVTANPFNPAGQEILLYGVPSGSQRDNSALEIQAIFYVTSCGSRLLEQQSVALPDILDPSLPDSVDACRRKLLSLCRDHACQTLVEPATVTAVGLLNELKSVKVTSQELRSLVSSCGEHVPVHRVVNDLLVAGTILACGQASSNGSVYQSEEYLLPLNTLQALSELVHSDPDRHTNNTRQKWFKVMTTGKASCSELSDLMTSIGSQLSIDVLEPLGVVFRFQTSDRDCPSAGKGDSGFSDSSVEFLIPYFLTDLPGEAVGMAPADPRSHLFMVTFDGGLSWRQYYSVLGRLSAQPATQVVVTSHRDCCITQNGLRLQLHCRKNSDVDIITVFVSSTGVVTADQVEKLFSRVIPPSLPFRLLPLEDSFRVDLSSMPVPRDFLSQDTEVKSEDTQVKHAAAAPVKPATAVRSLSKLPLGKLDYSVINDVAIQLSVNMTTGHGWRSVAERAGRNMAQIMAYEIIVSNQVPAMTFFREWILSGVTVQNFLDILNDLDRPDVRDIIVTYLRTKGWDVGDERTS